MASRLFIQDEGGSVPIRLPAVDNLREGLDARRGRLYSGDVLRSHRVVHQPGTVSQLTPVGPFLLFGGCELDRV
jgi:hypothetical protein